MTDVLQRQTNDGGEIDFVNGQPVLTDSIETAVYLSLFGGNEEDSGLDAGLPKQWWGNVTELTADRRYRSETQYLLRSLTASTANLRRLEDAAARDLAWMLEEIVQAIDVVAGIPARNRASLDISIVLPEGSPIAVRINQPWGPSA